VGGLLTATQGGTLAVLGGACGGSLLANARELDELLDADD
jgi:hypothetical protein